MRFPVLASVVLAVFVVSSQTTLKAQVPTPAPASPTLWSFLGIPQAAQKMNAQMFNRRGNRPRLESRPQLLHLADPKNLESPVEPIKAAAEVKQAEDLKPQKIKAIKYLAEIGCGCYDKDKKITKALIAAMADCTEDVRLEAIKAIEEAASGECCANCSQKNCCGKDISAMLAKIAYELDETGCYVEPSERVREAAENALSVCCPNVGAPMVEDLPIEGTTPEPPPIEGLQTPPSVSGANAENQEASLRGQRSSRRSARLLNSTPTSVEPQQVSSLLAVPPKNIAMVVDSAQNIAKVHIPDPVQGELLKVWTSTDYGYRLAGSLEVFAVYGQVALVRPVGNLELAQLSPGTLVARSND